MSDLIDRQAAIDAVLKITKDETAVHNGWVDPYYVVEVLKKLPTIDAVPRQKYEEDTENAFAHGYTDAESNFRKMITDGELVEVVRCKDCIHQQKVFHEDKRIKEGGYYICGCELADGYSHVCLDDDFCSRAERRTDEL